MAIAAIYKAIFFASLIVGALSQLTGEEPKKVLRNEAEELALNLEEEKLAEEQSANAIYEFASAINDGIMDNMQSRAEIRDGHNVKGSYEYSDGFIRMTVNYSAGKDGFKILSTKTENLGDGPQLNIEGKANVRTSIGGQNFEYSITRADIGHLKERSKETPSLPQA